jgi:diaminohydroxyphosphoribosylaminopyrimidine deaminase/5-amino-6-(5-phosphoribosylamino)uracil reductase
MSDRSTDDRFLRRALDLARQGVGLASPNPHVGAVIVDEQNNIAGEGVYTYEGKKHAEILALEQAGEKARGATLYINLEPHAHQGRTPPCTDALIRAEVRRVVASMADPNPKVSGLGFEKLRAAGIAVEIGGLEDEARVLNEAFARYIRSGVPLVTLKSAMTLDGKIAPPPSSRTSHKEGVPSGGWITGDAARDHVHEKRHASDAILVGIGTVLADDPLLTDRSGNDRSSKDRSGKARRRPLLRVILDSRLRTPLDSRLVRSANTLQNDLIIFHSTGDEKKVEALEKRGILVEQIPPGPDGYPAFQEILRRLGQLEITSVMIEGGSTVNGAALAAGVVDKIFFYYAPKILPDTGAVPFARGVTSAFTLGLKDLHLHRFATDFAVEGYLRDPYADEL